MYSTPPNLPSAELLAHYAPLAPVEPASPLRIHVAPDIFALWEAWERETKAVQPVPYWAVPWPAAVILSRMLLARPEVVRGRRVLDLGCGGAAAGLAAARAGATRVTANDTDPVALHLAHCNARANGLTLTLEARDLSQGGADLQAEVILVGDLFYELVALHIDLFDCDKRLLKAFMVGYSFPSGYKRGFARRAMSLTLLFRFNVLEMVFENHPEARQAGSLEELGNWIWNVE